MRVAVVGVGLIGGSIALGARNRLGAEVSGTDRSTEALAAAIERGVLDRGCQSVADALAGAQVAFVAVPVGELPTVVGEALAAAPEDCVVSDVGSTKRAVVSAHSDPRFVGGHPLAGAESSGLAHARADLFDGAAWYLTPSPNTSGVLYERLHRLLHGLGARPAAIDPVTHDAILATVSHLPHVLANVLVSRAAAALQSGDQRLGATGPSFRDATRVAGASSAIWTDIYLSNADVLGEELDKLSERLSEVRGALAARDRRWLQAWNENAAADRRRLVEAQLAGEELFELRASVPNRPGVIAQIALALGRAGVNITDLALYPAPDRREGVVALWVAGENAARRTEQEISSLGHPVVRA
jgi:prephenate dehydrogenase